jgi:hypothetical protein
VSALGSLVIFIAGVSGGFAGGGTSTHGEGSLAYFIGALVAMLLAGVFTYLGLSAKPSDP